MKLIYIANSRIPTEKAHGFQISKMCESFSRVGAETELWVPNRKNTIKENVFDYYGVGNNFKVIIIKSFDFIKYDRILGRFAFYFQSLWFLLKLLRTKINKEDVVFSRAPEIIWLLKLKGAKTCYECHDWFGKNKGVALFFLKKADRIITTNIFIKNEFVKNNFNESKILVAPHGVNHQIFDLNISREEALKKLYINNDIKNKIENKKILLYTGSFKTNDEEKGISDILKAFKELSDSNLIFMAVGGTRKYIEEYLKMSRKLGVEKQVYFFEKRPQTDLALFQKIANALLMPFPDRAHYRHHMTPIKMFEYMVAKKPIIASNLPSIKEMFNKNNAVICNPDDPSDLAQKIKIVLGDEKLAKRIAEQAYKDVQGRTWENRAKSILGFLR